MYTRALSVRYHVNGNLAREPEHVYSLLLGRTVVHQIVSDVELGEREAVRLLLSAMGAGQ